MLIGWMTVLLCAGLLVSALLAVSLKGTVSAVVAAGLASLFAAVTYVFLAAPDVAMTEASIGSGLSTLIFLYAVNRTRNGNGGSDE